MSDTRWSECASPDSGDIWFIVDNKKPSPYPKELPPHWTWIIDRIVSVPVVVVQHCYHQYRYYDFPIDPTVGIATTVRSAIEWIHERGIAIHPEK